MDSVQCFFAFLGNGFRVTFLSQAASFKLQDTSHKPQVIKIPPREFYARGEEAIEHSSDTKEICNRRLSPALGSTTLQN